ncbi:KTSC domain-containing protein [Mesorhizobium sp. M1307]
MHEFEAVPPKTFAEFKAAFAKGRYFNDHIRNHPVPSGGER